MELMLGLGVPLLGYWPHFRDSLYSRSGFLIQITVGKHIVTRIEKRQMQRFSIELPARLTWIGKDNKHESLEQTTSNISAGGAYFKTQRPLSIGADVKINIELPLERFKNARFKKSYISVSGSVIRIDQQGMAIRFDDKFQISPMIME